MSFDIRKILKESECSGNKEWEDFWRSRKGTSGFLSFMRRNIVSREVGHYCDRYFKKGVYCECGCGSGEASVLLNKQERVLIGLDCSDAALSRAKRTGVFQHLVRGDILKLPFKDNVFDGIWNYGVMEHFREGELVSALKEFKRVLKRGSCAVMLWPYGKGPVSIGYEAYSRANRLMNKGALYPDGPSTIKDVGVPMRAVEESGMTVVLIELSPFMLFSNYAVVARA